MEQSEETMNDNQNVSSISSSQVYLSYDELDEHELIEDENIENLNLSLSENGNWKG